MCAAEMPAGPSASVSKSINSAVRNLKMADAHAK